MSQLVRDEAGWGPVGYIVLLGFTGVIALVALGTAYGHRNQTNKVGGVTFQEVTADPTPAPAKPAAAPASGCQAMVGFYLAAGSGCPQSDPGPAVQGTVPSDNGSQVQTPNQDPPVVVVTGGDDGMGTDDGGDNSSHNGTSSSSSSSSSSSNSGGSGNGCQSMGGYTLASGDMGGCGDSGGGGTSGGGGSSG